MLKVIVTAVFAAAVPFVSAFAADMPVPVLPAPVAPVSSWYLRGDIGVGAVHANGVDYLPNPNNNPSDFTIQSVGIGDQAFLNAGIGGVLPLDKVTPEFFRRLFYLNVAGPLFGAQALVPLMKPGSSILITASAA